MRKARLTEEQMVAIIREADREPVSAVGKRHGVSEQTIYTWRKRFGSFQANDVRRLTLLVGFLGGLILLVAVRYVVFVVFLYGAQKKWCGCGRVAILWLLAVWVGTRRDGPARCSRWRDRR
jgi:putative transposase